MARGAKTRSQLLQRRYDEVVALHRHARGADGPVVIVVVESARRDELPVDVAPGTDDGATVLASMRVAEARAWLGDAVGVSKWDAPAPDAMDVAVVAAEGISVMRLTAR